MADSHEVKIAHASFWYTDGEGRQRVALRGDEVELNADDYERGVRFEAFASDEPLVDVAAAALSAASPSPDPLDIDASIDKVLAYVGDDPVRAGEALQAEQAKGDDARSTLVTKLEALAVPAGA